MPDARVSRLCLSKLLNVFVELEKVFVVNDEKAVFEETAGCKSLSPKPSQILKVTSQGCYNIFHIAAMKVPCAN